MAPMKLTLRDGIASVLLAAILVPYVGYLVRGEMPFIQDPRGMSAAALVLGLAAYLVAVRATTGTPAGRMEVGLATATFVLGVVAVALAETAAAEVLLAVFVAAIVVTWAVTMLRHAGLLPTGSPPTALTHR
jgi:hypothetical protein